jgi:hypothetical protein
MKIDEVNFQQVGNCASTELVGFCHDEKSERAGCIASTQKDSTFQLIVGFKQYDQTSTHKSWQRRSFVDNLLINLWQSQMVDKNETSNLRQCQSFVQISVRAWHPKIMYRNEAQMVVELSGLSFIGLSVLTELSGFVDQHELIELINSIVHVGHIKLFKLSRFIVHSSSEGAQISKLIVDYILISRSEGAQRAASKLIVICAFGLNELIKLISASRHQQLIVAYVKTNSKIYLIFGEECRTFCEGEWEQQVGNISLVGYTSRISLIGHIGLVGLISFIGLGFFGVNGLVGVIGLIGINSLIGPNDFIDHIGLVGYIGLVRHIDLVDYIGLFGHIGLVGRTLSFIGLSLIGYIGLSFIGLSGISGISGLIGQISLINLSASLNQLYLQQKLKYHGGSSKQQHSELPRCNRALPKLPTRPQFIILSSRFTCIRS